MIIKIGNMFESDVKTLVNTVNCVGVMGKGIAAEFKKKYPKMFDEYTAMCECGIVKPGLPYYYTDLTGASILNFPTKDHWRSPSRLSYIISGLKWFRENYQSLGITSIAFPKLGCGNGGLDWEMVGPIMYEYLSDLPIRIEVYAPYGTSSTQLTRDFLKENKIHAPRDVLGNGKKEFNKYWLLLLYVVDELSEKKYALNVGRTIFQKICYVLTRTGIPTGFHFVKGSYGPYAKEVANAITILSNANLMIEQRFGRMIETVVSPQFQLKDDDFTSQEFDFAKETIDLFSRIKKTEQAEMIATVLFSYDELSKNENRPTERAIYNYIVDWKPHWKGESDKEIVTAIKDLSSLGWMKPDFTRDSFDSDDEDIF